MAAAFGTGETASEEQAQPQPRGAPGLEHMEGGERQGEPGEFSLKKGRRGGDHTAVGRAQVQPDSCRGYTEVG